MHCKDPKKKMLVKQSYLKPPVLVLHNITIPLLEFLLIPARKKISWLLFWNMVAGS